MSTPEEVGRLEPELVGSDLPDDGPGAKVKAMLSKQDEILDKLNLILVAIEAANDGNSLFTALDTAEIKAELDKIQLHPG